MSNEAWMKRWNDGEVTDAECLMNLTPLDKGYAMCVTEIAIHMHQEDSKKYWYHIQVGTPTGWRNMYYPGSNRRVIPAFKLTKEEAAWINQGMKSDYRVYSEFAERGEM